MDSNNDGDRPASVPQKVLQLFYPLLLAYYPVLALYNHNITYVKLSTILRSLLVVTIATVLIGGVTYLFIRSLRKTALIVSLIMLLALSYGHIYIQIESTFGSPIRHRNLLGGALLILLILIFGILKYDPFSRGFSQFLSTASLVLLAMVLIESGQYQFGVYQAGAAAAQKETIPITSSHTTAEQPDFYVIILDAYTRADVLESHFGYDNSGFLQQLSDLGFYVADCSQSNYASTKLSLISLMFADYVDHFTGEKEKLPPMRASTINQTLKAYGYQTIAFENSAEGHFDLFEDIYLSRNQIALGNFDLFGGPSEFERMMVDTSILHFLADTEMIPGFTRYTVETLGLREHFSQTQFILAELEKLPQVPGPKFVLAHILVPHPPYIFTPEGDFFYQADSPEGYLANIGFVNNRLPSILNTIIEQSEPAPIIVVMGDHGPSYNTITPEMRVANLSAFLVNDAAEAQLNPQITPLNAMRVILNTYFDGSYPLLEDKGYYAFREGQLSNADAIPNNCPIGP